MEHHLIETIEDGVATLTLNRPESLNAFSEEMFDALIETVPRLNVDPNVRVIVLTGAGRAFCAGGDVKGMKAASADFSYEARVDALRRKHQSVKAFHESPKVTIASINGVAVGAGLSFAMACDFRLVARSASLVTGFVKVGYSGDCGGTYFLSRLIGVAKAQELYLTSDPISAEEALRLGLVSRVIEDGELAAETARLAARFASGPALSYRAIKNNFRRAMNGSLEEVLDHEAFNQVRLVTSADHNEAVAAFKEKRKPVFRGR